MIQVTTAEAQQRLPDLLAAAETGVSIEIHGDNGRTFVCPPIVRPRP